MTLTYIFHSSFVLDTENCLIVFDFWLDPEHLMPEILNTSKPVYVFSSHFHEDHFTKEIFTWRETYPKVNFTYILSKDILKHRRAKKDDADVWMAKGAVWEDNNIMVYAMGRNDSGVSWIIETEGKNIFHAGDLNNWYAKFLADENAPGTILSNELMLVNPEKDEKRYLGELKDIAKVTDSFDLVMFPIDARIGNGYTRGGRQFIERFKVGMFVPMHFVTSGYESAWRMKEFTDAKDIPFWAISKIGDKIEL